MFFRYASLLSQYSAVSFGDPLFGCFVVLPLTQRHDIKFRRAVWDEHIGVLRALAIPLDQVTRHWCLVLLHGHLICHVTLFGSFIEAVHTVSCCDFVITPNARICILVGPIVRKKSEPVERNTVPSVLQYSHMRSKRSSLFPKGNGFVSCEDTCEPRLL